MGRFGSRRHHAAVRLAALTAVSLIFASNALADDRSIDGSGNNLGTFTLGQAGTNYIRELSGAHYADGISSPNGSARPDARTLSNLLMQQGEASILDPRSLSAMVYTWGQFIDHDLNLRSDAVPFQPLNINVPATDQQFDPLGTGTQVIPMLRSAYDPLTGTSIANPRQQVNHVTSYLDASMVYGSDSARAAWLRSGTGGMLKSVAAPTGAMLPKDDGTQVMDGLTGPSTSSTLFVAGDGRANEQIGITSLHTLLLREHNRQATLLARQNPTWTDEQIYQHARAIVSGEVQSITYNQFLPALLGNSALPSYSGYSPTADPSASNAFAAVAFRVGHSMLDDDIERVGFDGNPIAAGNLPLKNAFFNPSVLAANGGIDPVLRGVTTRIEQAVDLGMVEDIRSFLFGAPGAGGLDLAALDIQRARDHGLSDYNTMRQDFGLTKITNFNQITADPSIQAQLQSLYGSVDNIDAFVGCLAEDHLAGSSVGPLTSAIIADQFRRTRDGDRFFYLNDSNLSASEQTAIGNFTLSDLIRRNTFVRNIQDNVFFAGAANLGPSWNLSTGASWNATTSWAGGLPNSAGAFATFQSLPAGAATVTLDAPIILGSMQLDTPATTTFAPGAGGSITFDNLGSNADIIITRGGHTIAAPSKLTDSLTVLYQGAGTLNLGSTIGENYAGRSITIDGSYVGPNGGGVTTLSGSNSFTGGVAVTRSLVNLNHLFAQGSPGSVASASDNGQITLGFTPTASHRFSIGDLGAISGNTTQLGALSVGTNFSLAPGAMIVRPDPSASLPASLPVSGSFYNAFTADVSGAAANVTIGSTSATPFKGIGADRIHSYTWGTNSNTITFAGDVDLVSIGSSILTIPAKVTGGAIGNTLTKRGSGTVKLTNSINDFASSNINVQSGTLQFAYSAFHLFGSTINFSTQPGGTLVFNDGFSASIAGPIVNNGAILKPAGAASQLIFAGPLSGNGILLAQDQQVGNSGSPNFIQTPTSTIQAHAIVFINGTNNFVGGVAGLDPNNSSPIISITTPGTTVHLTGKWDGDGSAQNSWLVLTNGGRMIFDAGSTIDTIADSPGQLRSFSGRGDGTGTVEFADGFVANQSDHAPGVTEFYVWSPGNFTWISRNSLNFPDSNIEINQEDGGTWIVATHDQTAECGLTTSRSFTINAQTNLTLARSGAWAVFDGTKTVTKTGSGTMTIAGENAVPSGATARIMSAVGSTLNITGGHFVTMTDMGRAATGAGANGVFGAPGLPDADDVVTIRYAFNVGVSGLGSTADFNASQHLLSLKVNAGGVANVNDFTYGGSSHTTLLTQTLTTDSGSGTLNVTSGNGAIASTSFSVGPSSTLNKIGPGSLNIAGSSTLGSSAQLNLVSGTTSFNVPASGSVTVGSIAPLINVGSAATLSIFASGRDPLSDQTFSTRRANIANDGEFQIIAGSSKAGTIDGNGHTTLNTAGLLATHIQQTTLTLQGSSSLTIGANGGASGTSRLSTLAVSGSPGAWTSKLDLKDNDLIVDYPTNGADPIATLTDQIKTARANGSWTGNGITSTLADMWAHSLGVGDNASLNLATFSGQAVDPTSILIKYTYAGDANLDGQVDASDLAALSLHWQSPTGIWTGGDFNYDGNVDISDLYLLIHNWQAGVSSPLGPALGSVLASLGLPQSAVPEPTGIGMMLCAGAAALSRRIRRR